MGEELVFKEARSDRTAGRLPINTPYYNCRGDFLAVYFSDEDSYSERMDDVVTVYKSKETHRLTGCKLKGVTLLAKNVKTICKIHDKDIKVGFILLSAFGHMKPHQYIYDLSDRLADMTVSVDELLREPC